MCPTSTRRAWASLAGARVTAQNAGARLVLASINPHVRKIIDSVNLTQFFVIADSEGSGMSLLSGPEPVAGGALAPDKQQKAKTQSSAATDVADGNDR